MRTCFDLHNLRYKRKLTVALGLSGYMVLLEGNRKLHEWFVLSLFEKIFFNILSIILRKIILQHTSDHYEKNNCQLIKLYHTHCGQNKICRKQVKINCYLIKLFKRKGIFVKLQNTCQKIPGDVWSKCCSTNIWYSNTSCQFLCFHSFTY